MRPLFSPGLPSHVNFFAFSTYFLLSTGISCFLSSPSFLFQNVTITQKSVVAVTNSMPNG